MTGLLTLTDGRRPLFNAGMTALAPSELIVVGFDGSPASGTALRWAYEEAALRHAGISAVMAVPLYPVAADVRTPLDAAAPTRGLRAFERLVASIGQPEVSATLTVREGVPSAVLRAHAYRLGASLLIVGRRGRGSPGRVAFGSLGDALVQHPGGPVVVIVPEHAPPSRSGDRVAVGVDGSPASLRALQWAAAEASLRATELDAVTSPASDSAGGTANSAPAEPRLHRVVHRRVLSRHATEALLRAADGAQLVVVGSRGLGRIRRHVLGSTSHAVLRHSPVPVAIVPAHPSFAVAQEGSGAPGLVEA